MSPFPQGEDHINQWLIAHFEGIIYTVTLSSRFKDPISLLVFIFFKSSQDKKVKLDGKKTSKRRRQHRERHTSQAKKAYFHFPSNTRTLTILLEPVQNAKKPIIFSWLSLLGQIPALRQKSSFFFHFSETTSLAQRCASRKVKGRVEKKLTFVQLLCSITALW